MQYFEIIPNDAMKLPIMSGLGYSDIDCAYGPVIRDMYIVQRKILQAKSMLLETNASISTIATSLGFYDTLAFSKFFKSMAGTSPSAFRNSK